MVFGTYHEPQGTDPAWRLPGCDPVDMPSGERKWRSRGVSREWVVHFLQRSASMHNKRRNDLPSHIRQLFDTRNACLTRAQILALPSAYAYLPGTQVQRKGIYVWVHKTPSITKVYVGSYFSSCLVKRTKQHIASANRTSYAATSHRWRRFNGQQPGGLYSHMLRHGVQDLLVFPLEILPESATQRQVLQAEQRWIDRFQSKLPAGYNARNAARGADLDQMWCVGRYFSTRNMCRRVYAAYIDANRGTLSEATFRTYFTPRYLTKTLAKMHMFCRCGAVVNGVSATDLLGEWRVPDSFVDQLRGWIGAVLAERFNRPPPRPAGYQKPPRKLFVCSYWSTIFDKLDFHAAFTHDSALAVLPVALHHDLPVVGFKYGKPLGLKFCNHAKLARSLTVPQLHHILNSPCACERHSHYRSNGFVPDGCDHVITCSPDVLGTSCPADLKELFTCGPKHRPEVLHSDMTDDLRTEVKDALDLAFKSFQERYAGEGFSSWCSRVLHLLQQQLDGTAFANGVVFTNATKPHEPGTRFLPWLTSYDAVLRQLQADFVFTTADKLPNNYVVVCKKHYILKVLADLQGGHFYAELLRNAADPDSITTAAKLLLQKVKTEVPEMFGPSMAGCHSDEDLLKLLSVIPYEAALVKLHKDPVALRYLACSGRNGLKTPALWLTALFKGIHPDIVSTWHDLLASAGLDWPDDPPWYATRSTQVVDAVRRFNTINMTNAEFVRNKGWHGYDVVRLYTNIDLTDLTRVLSEVMGWAWDRHVGRSVVLVYKDSFHSPVWYTDLQAVYNHYGPPGSYREDRGAGMLNARYGKEQGKGGFYLFDQQHAVAVLRLLVENSYVRFGDQVFHQTRGIPMGINPAVYMANYYLFYYEFCFMQRLVQLVTSSPETVSAKPTDFPVADILALLACECPTITQSAAHAQLRGEVAMFLLHNYRCTVRFVDDFTSAPNPFTEKLLYQNQTLMGGLIRGIYPNQFLELESTPGDNTYCFSTLDVQIVTRPAQVQNEDNAREWLVQSYTKLYDKRRNACYRGIPIVQYTHVSSTLSVHSGYNILIGQLHRFRELIMVKDNYVVECARLVLRMQRRGYRLSILWRKLKHHLRLYPDTFGDTSYKPLYQAVRHCYDHLCSIPNWEYTAGQWSDCEEEQELLEVSESSSDCELEEAPSSPVDMDIDSS